MPYEQLTKQLVSDEEADSQLNNFVTNHVELPEKLANKNVNLVIEISGPGQSKFKQFFRN